MEIKLEKTVYSIPSQVRVKENYEGDLKITPSRQVSIATTATQVPLAVPLAIPVPPILEEENARIEVARGFNRWRVGRKGNLLLLVIFLPSILLFLPFILLFLLLRFVLRFLTIILRFVTQFCCCRQDEVRETE